MRRSGRTTILADKLIQQLFQEGRIVVKDHFNDLRANERLFQRIEKRLSTEHSLMHRRGMEVNRRSMMISLGESFWKKEPIVSEHEYELKLGFWKRMRVFFGENPSVKIINHLDYPASIKRTQVFTRVGSSGKKITLL